MSTEAKFDYHNNPEPLLATLSAMLADQGATKEVAVLANSIAGIRQIDYDNWNGGTYIYGLFLQIPVWLFGKLSGQKQECEYRILEAAQLMLEPFPNDILRSVTITPIPEADQDWRNRATAWLAGNGVTNQGRVRSDNIASRTVDGLLFRSQPEIFLYQALKSLGVSFAPLPVFVRGGDSYRRIEPDFVIVKSGIMLVVEVDGDTVHHETPAEAHGRTTMLVHEGVYVERVTASECGSRLKADECARKILAVLEKYRASR